MATRSFVRSILSLSFIRCWNELLVFTTWAVLITVLNNQGFKVSVDSTLLGVLGIVIGFVISYKTTAAFEKYKEGGRLWSQVVLVCRIFARTTWFYLPDPQATAGVSADEMKARSLIEKMTMINLLRAYVNSLKHYLRGEEGIYYVDLYDLVKYLPSFAFPTDEPFIADKSPRHSGPDRAASSSSVGARDLPPPPVTFPHTTLTTTEDSTHPASPSLRPHKDVSDYNVTDPSALHKEASQSLEIDTVLFPANVPPRPHLFDYFPFSLFAYFYTRTGRILQGKLSARLRIKMRRYSAHSNMPLQILFYLTTYVRALRDKRGVDSSVIEKYISAIDQLTECLTSLERLIASPMPTSYLIHIRLVTIIYVLIFPVQVWTSLKWLTIPATSIVCFIFFSLLVASDELESDPFGYDSEIDLDRFTSDIIQNELHTITSQLPSDPFTWTYSRLNDRLFSHGGESVTPDEWLHRGYRQIREELLRGGGP